MFCPRKNNLVKSMETTHICYQVNGIQHQSYWICKNYINLFQSHSSRGLRTRQPSTLPTGDVSEVVQTQSQRHHDGNAREITTPTGVEVPKHDITPDHREVWPRHSILLPPPYRSGEFFLPLSLPNCNSWSSTPHPHPPLAFSDTKCCIRSGQTVYEGIKSYRSPCFHLALAG